jgi:hypothetical protein
MAKDVIITPASGLIDFKNASNVSVATISLSDTGQLSLGNTASNVYIGDGTTSVDIIFEQNGKIRALTGKTLTLGQSDSSLNVAAPVTYTSPDASKTITATMLNAGSLSFTGSTGQLLSVTNSFTGTIFSANDVSGIPSIEVLDTGVIKLGQYGGNVLIGTGTDDGSNKLQVNGDASINSVTVGKGAGNTANNNTAVGYQSLKVNNTNGQGNVAVGYKSLTANTTGVFNTSIGYQSMISNQSSMSNTSIGANSMYSNTTGDLNIAVGNGSFYSNNNGFENTVIGNASMYSVTTGSKNITLGYQAARYITGGSTELTSINNSIYIGHSTQASAATGVTNETVIGYNAIGLGSNTIAIGNLNTTSAKIFGALSMQVSSVTYSVGYLEVPQVSKSVDYPLVLTDSGKHIFHPAADTTARTFTIPANGTVAFPIGSVLTFINEGSAGTVTIAITTDVLVLAGAGTTGSRTLAANGIATAIKITSTKWMISGSGLT